jgi:hypothetical protein
MHSQHVKKGDRLAASDSERGRARSLTFLAKRLLLVGLTALVVVSPCLAQEPSPREELLRLVPPDAGFCLLVSNLRERAKSLDEAAWYRALCASPIGQMLAAAPEAKKLAKQESELRQTLQIGWEQLRDDILGDLVVVAYRQGPPDRPEDEDGLFLLWARKPVLLKASIDRLNEMQIKAEQVKELKAIDYRGHTYFRRSEPSKTHYYFVDGSLLAVSPKEAVIRKTIERRQQKQSSVHPLAEQVRRARAEKALATVWLNPRAFDAELQRNIKDRLGPEAQVLESFFRYWKALDAVVLSANAGDALEVTLSLQARIKDLPRSARRLFSGAVVRSELWERFPADSLLRIAGRLDAEALTDTVAELTPHRDRTTIADAGQRYLGAYLGLDLVKDVLPNIGPDWGICIAPGDKNHDLPLMVAALAVRPGKAGVDKSLYKAAHFAAGLAVFGYNSSHPDQVRLKTKTLDKVEVQCLVNDEAFPAGFQPCFALKDGYFLLASSPEAIRGFKKTTAPVVPAGENPIAQLSLSQLSKFIKARRQKVISGLAEKNQIPGAVAEQWLDVLLAGLGLFDHLAFSERRDADQVTWSLRLSP